MRKIVFVSMFLCLLFMGACTKSEVTREKALRLGMERYAEFTTEKNWPPEQFREPRVEYVTQAEAWQLTFKTKEEYSKRIIVIAVGRYGGVEAHFFED
jgi:hypothetical protein